MTKREFMRQFVLNRAATVDLISGESAAKQALEAWDYIERTCRDEPRPTNHIDGCFAK